MRRRFSRSATSCLWHTTRHREEERSDDAATQEVGSERHDTAERAHSGLPRHSRRALVPRNDEHCQRNADEVGERDAVQDVGERLVRLYTSSTTTQQCALAATSSAFLKKKIHVGTTSCLADNPEIPNTLHALD
jgi:hypothetical protein